MIIDLYIQFRVHAFYECILVVVLVRCCKMFTSINMLYVMLHHYISQENEESF